MSEKQTVYRIRYTADNRVRSVHVTEEPKENETRRTVTALVVIAAGWIVAAEVFYVFITGRHSSQK